jgi:hypothetical protein
VNPLPSTTFAAESAQPVTGDSGAAPLYCASSGAGHSSCLPGTHDFDQFIGFMSNIAFNIDPRAVTELMPITGASWVSTIPALPNGNIWIPPGAALTLALSERLAVGINQGGYAVANFDRSPVASFFRNQLGVLENRNQFAGQHQGWLNLGGFGQYTLLQDVPAQSLLTAGLRWEAPCGSKDIFQGNGPAKLAPYFTAGKGFGDFHVLANAGFQFPTGSGGFGSFFYGCLHLDYGMFGWLYPLVEFNGVYHTTGTAVNLPTREGFIDLGNFESTGNLVTLAVGANAVLVRSKLEFGAVYTTPIATERNFTFNGFLAKMVIRF